MSINHHLSPLITPLFPYTNHHWYTSNHHHVNPSDVFSDTGAFVNNSPKQLWRYTPSLRRGHWLRKSTPATRPAAQGGKSRTFWPKNGGFLMWILDCWRVDNYSRYIYIYIYIYVRVFSVAYSIQSLKKSDPDIWKEHISNQFFFGEVFKEWGCQQHLMLHQPRSNQQRVPTRVLLSN